MFIFVKGLFLDILTNFRRNKFMFQTHGKNMLAPLFRETV